MSTNPVYGCFQGVVVDNVMDELPHGAIKVNLPQLKICKWFLPCTPWTGPEMGFYMIPPIGATVVVMFESGDKQLGHWLGGYWSICDSDAGRISYHMEDRQPMNRCIVSESGHSFELDDTEGEESVRLNHRDGSFVKMWGEDEEYKMEIYSKGDLNIRVDGKLRVQVEGDSNFRFGSSVITHIATNLRTWVRGTVTQSCAFIWTRIAQKIFDIDRGES